MIVERRGYYPQAPVRRMKPTDTTGLNVHQKARLAYALTVIRETQNLRGWSQYRAPKSGALSLVKRNRNGVIQQVYVVTYG